MILTKICSKCFVEKELTEFNKHPTSKGGVYASCKSCVKSYLIHRRSSAEGREEIRLVNASWRANNLDKARESTRTCAKARRERDEKFRTANVEYSKKYYRSTGIHKGRSIIYDAGPEYIIKLIKKQAAQLLKTEEIPLELIAIKQQSIILKRELKKKKHDNANLRITD